MCILRLILRVHEVSCSICLTCLFDYNLLETGSQRAVQCIEIPLNQFADEFNSKERFSHHMIGIISLRGDKDPFYEIDFIMRRFHMRLS